MEIARQLKLNKIEIGVDIAFFDAEDWGKEGGGPESEDSYARYALQPPASWLKRATNGRFPSCVTLQCRRIWTRWWRMDCSASSGKTSSHHRRV